jgi:hypothetical protein
MSNADIIELRNVASLRFAWKWRKPFNKTDGPYHVASTLRHSQHAVTFTCTKTAPESDNQEQPGIKWHRNQLVGDMYVTAGRQFPQVGILIKVNPLPASRVSLMSTL